VGSDCGVAVLNGARFTSELRDVLVKALWSSVDAVNGFRTFAAAESGVYARMTTAAGTESLMIPQWEILFPLQSGTDYCG